jgi:hypothetical protein
MASSEDRATLESDLSAAGSGYATGQGEISALSSCPVDSPKSDKLNHGKPDSKVETPGHQSGGEGQRG